MHFKLSVVLLLAIVCTALAIVCPPNYCDKANCSNAPEKDDCEQNQNGIFEERGTFCGCCPACLTKLTEGESCRMTMMRGMPPRAKCASGLTCNWSTAKCVAIE